MVEKRKTGTQPNRRQWNERGDAVWRHSAQISNIKSQKFSVWKLFSRFGFLGFCVRSERTFTRSEKSFSVSFMALARPDDCVTSDRSVDELLMRSHFSTLHRRNFSVCVAFFPLCFQKFFAFSRFSVHTQSRAELFLLSRELWRRANCARVCAWKAMKLVS